MWLLNAHTRELEPFIDESSVNEGYAILSHTWGEEELSFDDIKTQECRSKKGYVKVKFACSCALHDGYEYVWIDTCCIDKRSSAELSEAINSMFRWYQNAAVCYVLLSDVEDDAGLATPPATGPELSKQTLSQVCNSRWFTRGWTLQELIAPSIVKFYDRMWHFIGDKASLEFELYSITSIDAEVLRGELGLDSTSVAKRMSWAANRSTSRGEDQAYALLGIFDISMPMLYGEGTLRAFARLQEEILRSYSNPDHSILAWQPWDREDGNEMYQNLLSPSPRGFRNANKVVSWGVPHANTFELTPRGLLLDGLAQAISRPDDFSRISVALNCRYEDEPLTHITMDLEERQSLEQVGGHGRRLQSRHQIYDRRRTRGSFRLPSVRALHMKAFKGMSVVVARAPYKARTGHTRIHLSFDAHCMIAETIPPGCWDTDLSTLNLAQRKDPEGRTGMFRAMVEVGYRNIPALSEDDPVCICFDLSVKSNHMRFGQSCLHVYALPKRRLRDMKPFATADPQDERRFHPGEQRTLGFGGRDLVVKATYVTASDETFWSVHISRPSSKSSDFDPRSTMDSLSSLGLGPREKLRFDAGERAHERRSKTAMFWGTR